ncbi:cytidine deaminase [Pseudoalteromonas xiamenensis]
MLSQDMLQSLYERIKASRGKLLNSEVKQLCKSLGMDVEALMLALLPVAAKFAKPPISNFYVGAIALDRNLEEFGDLYFGANLEFAHEALSLVVHAEQSAINNAWSNGAAKVDLIAITDAPCGYCRQFMNELHNADELNVTLPHKKTTLRHLLPEDFGPNDLGNSQSVFNSEPVRLQAIEHVSDSLLKAASRSYAPYSGNYSAVEIETEHGNFVGSYIENAAYSPSLSPLQSALSQMELAGLSIDECRIHKITLLEIEGKENQLDVAKAVLNSLLYKVELNHVKVRLV